MAQITTYATLQTAVEDWLARDDLTNFVPTFIQLFETVANRRLRVRQMETSGTITMSSGSGTIPTDFLAYRKVVWPGSTAVNLEYVSPEWLVAAYPDSGQGTPGYFTIEGTTIKVRPVDDTSLTFHYYQKIAALTEAATTNWLLLAHPDVYLFGALCEAQGFNVDPDKMAMWGVRRDTAFDQIEALSRQHIGPAAIRLVGTVV